MIIWVMAIVAEADKKCSTNLRVAGGESGAGSEGLTTADERLKERRADASKNNVPTALPKPQTYRAGGESLKAGGERAL